MDKNSKNKHRKDDGQLQNGQSTNLGHARSTFPLNKKEKIERPSRQRKSNHNKQTKKEK